MSDNLENGAYSVRVFTPAEEIPFSGHAVLGAAYVLQSELLGTACAQMLVDLPCGRVNVEFTYRYASVDAVWMTHLPPEYGPMVETEVAAAVLGLPLSEISDDLPVIQVSTGMPFLMIPLRSRSALSRARVVPEKCELLKSALSVRALYPFTTETYDLTNRFGVRMFASDYGIPEDAATGAGGGCLAAYALNYIVPDATETAFSIEQGYQMGRPSLLFARASRESPGIRVDVGGRVLMVAQGNFV